LRYSAINNLEINSNLEDKSMTGSLVVDFHGPIAFRFSKDWVWAYLPPCEDHTCNVLTDSNDLSPDDHVPYALQGPLKGKAQLVSSKVDPVIQMDWRETNGNVPNAHDCYCTFQLPLPDFIFGLRAEWVELSKPDGSVPWSGSYARGLRLYYSQSDIPTFTPLLPDGGNFDPSYLTPGDVQYRIEVRFRDMNKAELFPYEDALMCSAAMRSLFPPLDQWEASFQKTVKYKIHPRTAVVQNQNEPKNQGLTPDPFAISNVVGHRPVDCGANVIVFDDGGLFLAKDSLSRS
jgi:hypothetical protein